MRSALLGILPPYTTKEIPWTSGSDTAEFEPSCIPKVVGDGPTAAYAHIAYATIHFRFQVDVATAALQGEDCYRFPYDITVEQVDDEKRCSALRGDSMRLVGYAHLGPSRTHEHQDVAVGNNAIVYGSVTIPFVKPFLYNPTDTGLPAWALKSIKVRMASEANLSLGTSAVTFDSGKYWVTFDCYPVKGVIMPAVDCWYEHDFDTSDVGEILLGGRLQDLYLMIPGANGGQTLANLDTVLVEGVFRSAQYKQPTLQQRYHRMRDAALNLSSTKGNPLRSDPFTASASGTLRALAPILAAGNKCWDGPELARAMVRITTTAALPATPRIIARAMKRKTDRMREYIMDTFDVTHSYVKTAGKSKRSPGAWSPEQKAYLPEKFFRMGAGGEPAPGLPRMKANR